MQIWELEPNHMEFIESGFKCQIKRRPEGHLVGYILIPEDNIFYGINYDDIYIKLKPIEELSYSEYEGSYWKIGFGFAKVTDILPYDTSPELFEELSKIFPIEIKQEYRGIEQAISVIKDIVYKIKNYQSKI